MSLEVLRLREEKKRQFLQENKFVVHPSGSRPSSENPAAQLKIFYLR